MSEKTKTEFTDAPVCPHCAHVMSDPEDYVDAITYQGDEWVCVDCPNCEKGFEIADHVVRSFSTRPDLSKAEAAHEN